jgi:hypothetical protein
MKDEADYVCDTCGEEIVLPIDLSASHHARSLLGRTACNGVACLPT